MLEGARMQDWVPAPLPDPKPVQKRSFEAFSQFDSSSNQNRTFIGAALGRNLQFMQALRSADMERKGDLQRLRAHARHLSRNNPFAARYHELVPIHIVGPDGIRMESNLVTGTGKPKVRQNKLIEAAWSQFWEAPTIDGRLSGVEFQKLVAKTASVDGEVLVRKVYGRNLPHGIAFELIDADRLEHRLNSAPTGSQGEIRMGVEVDAWGRPAAYWVRTRHPSEAGGDHRLMRIPAEQIIHVGRPDRLAATRFLPWSTPVMWHMNLLGRYWESEVVAANAEADRIGFLTSKADEFNEAPDPTRLKIPSDYATFIGLPAGIVPEMPTIQHPNTAFGEFSRSVLRGIASGLGVAYHTLTGDVSNASYSSARVALLEERDEWRSLQRWFIDSFLQPVFRAWIESALAHGDLNIPSISAAEICRPKWFSRGWAWIDPLKDVQASIAAIAAGLSTHQEELGAQGYDWRDLFAQAAMEREEAKDLGLVLSLAFGGKDTSADLGEDKPTEKTASEGDSNA